MKPQIFEFSAWYGLDKLTLAHLTSIIKKSGHTVLGTKDYNFVPQGYTCVWLLAESHLACHTYPEHNLVYIQLSSCSESKYNTLLSSLQNTLKNEQNKKVQKSIAKPLQ